MNLSKITSIHWYITAFLAGFLAMTILLTYHQVNIENQRFVETRAITGVIESINSETNELRLKTLDELNYTDVSESAYSVEMLLTDEAELTEQSLLSDGNTIVAISPKNTLQKSDLVQGDLVYVTFNEEDGGFLVVSLLRGTPTPVHHRFIPQYLQLQAQILAQVQETVAP